MKINFDSPFQLPEEKERAIKVEDARASLVAMAAPASERQEKADEDKKTDFAQAGDTVKISEEAREKQRLASVENSPENERHDEFTGNS